MATLCLQVPDAHTMSLSLIPALEPGPLHLIEKFTQDPHSSLMENRPLRASPDLGASSKPCGDMACVAPPTPAQHAHLGVVTVDVVQHVGEDGRRDVVQGDGQEAA